MTLNGRCVCIPFDNSANLNLKTQLHVSSPFEEEMNNVMEVYNFGSEFKNIISNIIYIRYI